MILAISPYLQLCKIGNINFVWNLNFGKKSADELENKEGERQNCFAFQSQKNRDNVDKML